MKHAEQHMLDFLDSNMEYRVQRYQEEMIRIDDQVQGTYLL